MSVHRFYRLLILVVFVALILGLSPILGAGSARAAAEPPATPAAPAVLPAKDDAFLVGPLAPPPGPDAIPIGASAPFLPPPAFDAPGAPAALSDLNLSTDAPPLPRGFPAPGAAVAGPSGGSPSAICGPWQCWRVWRKEQSSCQADLSKRALTIGLAYPMYEWTAFVGSSRAAIYFRYWKYSYERSRWEYYPWWGPMISDVSAPNYKYVFLGNGHFASQPWTGEISGWGSLTDFNKPRVDPVSVAGLTGGHYFMIQYYVYLSGMGNDGWNTVDQGFVRFWGNNVVCGYTFLSQAQSATVSEEAALPAAPAPTPPALLDGRPRATYLPLIIMPAAPATRPTPTPTATFVAPPRPTPGGAPTTGDMRNADFEAGRNAGWQEYSSLNYTIVRQGPKGFPARSGQYLAWLGGVVNERSAISQTLTVPASHPYLSLYLMASSNEDYCYYDTAKIWVDEYHVASIGLCKPFNFHSWLRGQIDMRPFAGQQVAFRIEVENDETLISHVFVDDLMWESGVVLPTVTPTPAATPTRTPTPAPSGGIIRNPGFELGDNGDWGSATKSGIRNIFLNDGARSGRWLAWLGGIHNEDGYIEQTLYIPHDRPYLTYWGWISSQETSCVNDTITFYAGSTSLGGYGLCAQYNNTRWGQGSVNLKAYSGTTQRIRIRVQTNSALLSSLYLDDFAFAAAAPVSATASTAGSDPVGGHPLPGAEEGISSDNRFPSNEPESKEPDF